MPPQLPVLFDLQPRPNGHAARPVTLVATVGPGSMDGYSAELARRLPVRRIVTDVYQRSAKVFNVPLMSRQSLRAMGCDVAFLARLRELDGPVHLPNQHLGRYGRFLSAPYVVSVHDLIRLFDCNGHDPLIHRPNRRDRIFLGLDYAGIRRAAAVIAVSHTTKRDLVDVLGLPSERVFVVHPGIDHERFHPVPDRLLDDPYVLFVGSEQPRKNLLGLLRAFAALKRQRRFRSLKLVKVGRPGGGEAPFRQRTLRAISDLGLEGEVVITDRVDDDELVGWYSGAEAMALPSLYEGFGLPPVEAMACGCPAVVSNAGSLPEVAGDAALVVDPRDDRTLTRALHQLLQDAGARRELIGRGLTRARRFCWDAAARDTLRVYTALAEADPP